MSTLTENYISSHIDTVINSINPVEDGFDYVTDHGTYFSKFLQKVPMGKAVSVELRTHKKSRMSYFLSAKI